MMAKILPKNPDLETEAETYSTWRLSDWRKMDRKSHGPVFKCGGFPWLVHEGCLPGLILTLE
jgi:ubiquitin carboxyl-terminal hydrolase 7